MPCSASPAAFGRLCVETSEEPVQRWFGEPAAFGRLCVETPSLSGCHACGCQPPSGGCVLKHKNTIFNIIEYSQPPSGGCVLKRRMPLQPLPPCLQPPSGGCVLKRLRIGRCRGRLQPAAFGRLCVETICYGLPSLSALPAAFGRLCVETSAAKPCPTASITSRLRAAVC